MTTAGPVTFSGLSSGIDTQSIVASLVAIQQAPLNALTAQDTAYSTASTDLSSFMSGLSSLDTLVGGLADPIQFASFAATSSDPSVVASVTGSPTAGSYSVQVTSLAQQQQTESGTQTSSTGALGLDENIGIQVGGSPAVDVSVSPTDSLADIASNINLAGAGVTASVLYDGSQYRLVVAGLSTGVANAITFNETGGAGQNLGLATPKNTFQPATDAAMTVDGISVTRPTNQVTGVIPGVTMALTNTMTAPATVSVAPSTAALTTQIQGFVSAYNAVVTAAHTLAGFGSASASDPLLAGDQSIRSTLDQLSSIVGQEVPGTSGDYTTLGSVGISMGEDGTLTLNTSTLASAVEADPQGVSQLFTTNAATGATGVMGTLKTALDALTTGADSPIQEEVTNFGKEVTTNQAQATAMQARITAYQTQLQAQFTQMEIAMSEATAEANSMTSLTKAAITSEISPNATSSDSSSSSSSL
jgi:flagellar hook-associated protein 2